MPGSTTQQPDLSHVEVNTLADRNLYPDSLRTWGMGITVIADANPLNNQTYVLQYGFSSTSKSDNANWVPESRSLITRTTKTLYKEFPIAEHSAVTSASDIVVTNTELDNGEAVTIHFLWTAKDDDTNFGAGGLFLATWTKAAGAIQKVADNSVLTQNDIGGTFTISTSDSGGSIAINVQLVSATGNFSYSGYVKALFRKNT